MARAKFYSPAEACLDENILMALAKGELEFSERSVALAHLDGCSTCRTLLVDECRELSFIHSIREGATTLEVGSTIADRYEIRRFISQGGMGEVYEAWDSFLCERVALKTVSLAAIANQALRAVDRFKQEVQLARRIADPHVSRIHDFTETRLSNGRQVFFLTMEFIDGETLGARLRKRGAFPENEVLVIARQLLRGLSASHGVGVLHRDLKSENIMLKSQSPQGSGMHAMIVDFGLARFVDEQANGLTQRSEFIGSPGYVAPEQLEMEVCLTPGTDIYALGVVFFEMLTGCLPFKGRTPFATALLRLKERAPAPSRWVPELSPGWDALVLRCLERDMASRFQSTEEVVAALDSIEAGSSGKVQEHKHRGAFILAGAVVVLLFSVLVLKWRDIVVAASAGPKSVAAFRPTVPKTNSVEERVEFIAEPLRPKLRVQSVPLKPSKILLPHRFSGKKKRRPTLQHVPSKTPVWPRNKPLVPPSPAPPLVEKIGDRFYVEAPDE